MNFTKSDGALDLRLAERQRLVRLSRKANSIYGDIESLLIPVSENSAYRIVKEIIDCDFQYTKTKTFNSSIKSVRDKQLAIFHKVRNPGESHVHRYFQYVISLIASIEKCGVLNHADAKRILGNFDSHGFSNTSRKSNCNIGIVVGPAEGG